MTSKEVVTGHGVGSNMEIFRKVRRSSANDSSSFLTNDLFLCLLAIVVTNVTTTI